MLSQQEALERIRTGELAFEPFRMRLTDLDSPRGEPRPDWVISLGWDESRFQFSVEYKSRSTPKALEAAIGQARAAAGANHPMVMVPYLSDRALARLTEASVSGIDFSGNGLVVVPGRWFVLRTGAKNRFPDGQPIKAIYSGTSSLVGRAFLLRREFDQVQEIQDEIAKRGGRISLGTVSKVLRGLEEDLIVARDPVIRVIQPDMLLDRLIDGYVRPSIDRRVNLQAPDVTEALRILVRKAERLGLQLVGKDEGLYTVAPRSGSETELYVSSVPPLLQGLDLDSSSPFPNLTLLGTSDQRVFFDRRVQDGIPWTSPLQAYLELASGGKREKETASQMRQDLLDYRYS